MAVEIIFTKDPVVVKIPMKPYVVKFLKKKFGDSHKISRRSWLGKSVVGLLTQHYFKRPVPKPKSFFTLKIPFTLCLVYGHFIDYEKLPEFADLCEKVFKDFMFNHVHINASKGSHGDAINSLRLFLAYYNISDDELKLDSAYRDYLRYLDDLNEKHPNMTQKNHIKNKVT